MRGGEFHALCVDVLMSSPRLQTSGAVVGLVFLGEYRKSLRLVEMSKLRFWKFC